MGNTPFDTVKTRMQGLEAGRYKNMFHCAGMLMCCRVGMLMCCRVDGSGGRIEVSLEGPRSSADESGSWARDHFL